RSPEIWARPFRTPIRRPAPPPTGHKCPLTFSLDSDSSARIIAPKTFIYESNISRRAPWWHRDVYLDFNSAHGAPPGRSRDRRNTERGSSAERDAEQHRGKERPLFLPRLRARFPSD